MAKDKRKLIPVLTAEEMEEMADDLKKAYSELHKALSKPLNLLTALELRSGLGSIATALLLLDQQLPNGFERRVEKNKRLRKEKLLVKASEYILGIIDKNGVITEEEIKKILKKKGWFSKGIDFAEIFEWSIRRNVQIDQDGRFLKKYL